MALCNEEDEVWKCEKHRTKSRRPGICPSCLRERLNSLCRHCGQTLPCSCGVLTTGAATSSSLSRFFSSSSGGAAAAAIPAGSSVMEGEPKFKRSRSLTVSFFRSKLSGNDSSRKWWNLRKLKSKKAEEEREGESAATAMMRRSQSVSVENGKSSSGKGRRWSFLSPMNILRLRRSKTSKSSVPDGSPMLNGD